MRSRTIYYFLATVFFLHAIGFLAIIGLSNSARVETLAASDDIYVSAQGQGDNSGIPDNPCDTALTAAEQKLYDLIMSYRESRGLPRIPISPSLSYVAQVHVRDLQAHPPQGRCNLHSWSDDGPWTPCCYTSDHARASCMWNKPAELTDYPGYGYEISSWSSMSIDPETALSGWKSSSGHNAVILSAGQWSRHPWGAIGIGIYGNYSVVWFGEQQDPCSR